MTSIPATMTAIGITSPGGPETLVPQVRPVPQPGAGEILVKVIAAGVNRPDVAQRMGVYPPPPGVTDIPGLEVAGVVVACGPGGARWKEGDEVTALVSGGGYAQYCVAHETHALPVPGGLTAAEAAAIPETFFTVWANVFDRGGLKSGETLLVHGGSGGIGTTAIQLGRAFGARVFTTAGSPEKCAVCESLGAERAIAYRREDFVAVVRELTGGRGVDVILDMDGGDYFDRNIDALAVEGRLVEIATLQGVKAELNIQTIMQRRLTITGSTLRARPVAEKGAIARAVRQHVWPLLESGAVKPVIHATFPLRAAAEAHRLMESGAHIGKLLLVP